MWETIGSIVGNIAGGLLSRRDSGSDASDNFNNNAALQREFAQNGVRWRVEDAKAAGIHPLFALGANTHSFSPVMQYPEDTDTGLGPYVSGMGQDIGRAIDATRTRPERDAARMTALELERAELQNDLLRSQIARLNQGTGPALPSSTPTFLPGQGDSSGLIENKPLERIGAAPGIPHAEPAPVVDVGFAQTPTGLAPIPSKDFADRGEDNLPAQAGWALRNQLLPTLGVTAASKPPLSALPDGAVDWGWDTARQEWYPMRPGDKPGWAARIRNWWSDFSKRGASTWEGIVNRQRR